MSNVRRFILCCFLSFCSAQVAAQSDPLAQEIVVKRLLNSIERNDHKDVLQQIDRLRRHDPKLSGEILYFEARSALETGNKLRAQRAAKAYARQVGRQGDNYANALSMLADLDREFEARDQKKQQLTQELQRERLRRDDLTKRIQQEQGFLDWFDKEMRTLSRELDRAVAEHDRFLAEARSQCSHYPVKVFHWEGPGKITRKQCVDRYLNRTGFSQVARELSNKQTQYNNMVDSKRYQEVKRLQQWREQTNRRISSLEQQLRQL